VEIVRIENTEFDQSIWIENGETLVVKNDQVLTAESLKGAVHMNSRHVDFEGRTKMYVSLFQIRRQHIFDPFHECADSARQIASMCYDEGHGERPAMKIGYDLHKRSAF
jgi:hypothetical protein